MYLSALYLTSTFLFTLGSAAPKLQRRVPGDLDTGFSIPKDTKNGVYSASFDDKDGAWVHDRLLDGNAFQFQNATGAPEKRDLLVKRQDWIDPGCGGTDLPHADTDKANDMLDAQCNANPKIWSRYNYYSIWEGTVAYACNFNYAFSPQPDQLCSADTRKAASKYITDNCGEYHEGWVSTAYWATVWHGGLSYGYEKSDAAFCGCGTGGCR